MPTHRIFAISLVIATCSGCQTTVGNYLSNRVRDFGECFRLQAGAGLGLGVAVRAAGLADVGVAVASYPRRYGVGWVYGNGYAAGWGETGQGWDGEVEVSGILWLVPGGSFIGASVVNWSTFHWRIEDAPNQTLNPTYSQHSCYSLLPAAFAKVGPELNHAAEAKPLAMDKHPWLWSGKAHEVAPTARIHAFDIEASLYAGIVYLKAGFSPGELADFLLGWFGADIAGDDRALNSSEGGPLP